MKLQIKVVVIIALISILSAGATIVNVSAQRGRPETKGCLPAGNGSLNFTTARRLRPENESCVRLLAEEKLWKSRMDVRASIYLIDVENAFAEPNGQVYLGQPLINRMLQMRGVEYAFQGGGFIVAHEYSHQFQFRIAKERDLTLGPGPVVELQADTLAGYWVGMRLREQKAGLESIGQGYEIDRIYRIALQAAYDVGDYAFNHPSHHGTPEQRREATKKGFEAGFRSKFGDPNDVFSGNGDEIIDWSENLAKTIYGR